MPKGKYMKEILICLVVDEEPNTTEEKTAHANGSRTFILGTDAGLFG
jgi:hypothetical protein